MRINLVVKVKKKAISVDGNNSAQVYRFQDYNIVEFTTKANALDYDSMDALKKATDKPLIIINESMQFSAGVNLTYTMDFANKGDFKSIELDLIEKIYNRSLEGKSYSVEDINAALGLSKKSLEIQKKIRTETINRINHRFKIIFNTEDELIERIRLEEESRFYKYIISEENGKKALRI